VNGSLLQVDFRHRFEGRWPGSGAPSPQLCSKALRASFMPW
jgi:hypothetical protein